MQDNGYNDKAVPLHDVPEYQEFHASTRQDLPDGMKPAMVAVALMTVVMIFLLCKDEFLSTPEWIHGSVGEKAAMMDET